VEVDKNYVLTKLKLQTAETNPGDVSMPSCFVASNMTSFTVMCWNIQQHHAYLFTSKLQEEQLSMKMKDSSSVIFVNITH